MNSVAIAPEKLIVQDFNTFKPNLSLVGNGKNIRESVNLLSVFGHSQKGHRVFPTSYSDTTIFDVVQAVSKSRNKSPEIESERLRREVSEHIDSAKLVLEELTKIALNQIKKEKSPLYDSNSGKLLIRNPKSFEPIYGLSQFDQRNYTVENPLMFLRGAYIASQMDSVEMRRKTMKRFPETFVGEKLEIGGGKCHVSNLALTRKMKIPQIQFFEKINTNEDIDELYKQGILIHRDELKSHIADVYKSHWINTYVREEKGFGCCDDATILGVGFLHLQNGNLEDAIDAFQGAAFIDTIDTIDKVTAIPVTGGADEYLGNYINTKFRRDNLEKDFKRLEKDYQYRDALIRKHEIMLVKKFGEQLDRIPQERILRRILTLKDSRGKYNLVDDKTIQKAIYFGAKNNYPNIKISDSVRRFNELQKLSRGNLVTPLQAHLNYLTTNEITENMYFGFEKMRSQDFYQIIDERLFNMQELGLIDIPNIRR